MKEQIQNLVENLEKSENNCASLIDALDILLKIQYEECINRPNRELCNVILRLIRETDYVNSPKKFLFYIYILKFISKRVYIPIRELILEDFITNFYKIKCNIIRDQIHELIFNSLSSDISEFDLILKNWMDSFTEFLEDKERFESFTELIFFIYNQVQSSADHEHQLKEINYKIIQKFSEVYDNDKSIFLISPFTSKLEYSQNLLFPLLINSEQVGEHTNRLFKNIIELIESNLNIKVFVFTLRIPNLIESLICSGVFLNYQKITTSLIQGILSKDFEIRKSTRFILEKLEMLLPETNLSASDTIDKGQHLNNITSFLCILDCYENFSIHLLKTNWVRFEKLLFDLQNSKREWWIECIIEIGLNHENLNVQRFVAFNTINVAIKNPDNLPSWIKHDTFFKLYLKYIVSSLNNKISLKIEEHFLKFIYFVLRFKSEWIKEYLEYILCNIKAFTPIRVLIYPLSIGVNNLVNINSSRNLSMEANIDKIKSLHNFDSYNIKTNISKDITRKYSFEYDSEFKKAIIIPINLFTKLLDLSIPIVKYIPILLRRDVYSKFLEIILNYFTCHEFSSEELIDNLIVFLGIIPEYLYYTNEINTAICNHILKCNLVIDSSFEHELLINTPKRWFDIIHLGIGFGRLKKIVGAFSNSNLILKSHAIFISSYYNYEEVCDLNDEMKKKIVDILEKIKILFDNKEEKYSIDIDLLWLDIHSLSVVNCNSYDFYLKKLWDWCVLVISDIGNLLTKIQSNINSQISLAMILKCLIHLQHYGKLSSTEKLIEVINNLLLISNNIQSKMLMNNKNLITWDSIRRKSYLYDIVDMHSINNDKYCIIQSSLITSGVLGKFSGKYEIFRENRLIQLFPANYRDLFNLISQLKFQLVNIFISENTDSISNLVSRDIYYNDLLIFNTSRNDFFYTKGSYLDWFKSITKILIYEIENSGMDNIYIWLLIEQLIGLVFVENHEQFEENFISDSLNKILLLIIKNCDELVDHGIYRNNLLTIFILILTKKEYAALFDKYNLLGKVIDHFYNKIVFDCENVRLFAFPLLDLIRNYIENCNAGMIEEVLNISKNNTPLKSKEFNTIILLANILVELIIFEEQGLTDGSKTRFQEYSEVNNIGIKEMIDIYNRCKIYEDTNSFIRHATIIYLSNIIEDSMENKNDTLIKFISLVIILLTKKLESAVPRYLQDQPSITKNESITKNSHLPNILLINEADISFKNAKKFPPLPNSNHHKIMINIWQSLCCLLNVLCLGEHEFNKYFIEFYFKHIQYLYTPDIRQYIDMLGCNLITLFPKQCIRYINEGLSNNINNHTQVIYSYLCISSYLIHFLKGITPLPLSDNSVLEKSDDIFFFEGDTWLKFNKEFLDEYILFFNLFVGYAISNSSLLRNIVLFTLFDAYNNNNVIELLKKYSENKFFSDVNVIDSLTVLKNAFQIENINSKIESIRNSKFYLNNGIDTSGNIFLINMFILEKSTYIRTIVYNIFNNKDILKMLKGISFAWKIWKPIKQCTVENIIPQDNLVEFSDQKVSQNFFNCCSCLDPILSELDGNILIDQVGIERELLATQDNHDMHILNSHLIFGDLRPSWSLYYLLKKIICKEMSGYYIQEYTKEKEVSSNITDVKRSSNYQLKFEPQCYNNQISGEPNSRRPDKQSLDRTGLIVIGSLIDKIPNIAGITRTCEIFRVNELLLDSKNVLNDPMFKQISVTAEKWLPINELKSNKIKEFVHKKRLDGYKIFGLEQTSSSVPINECNFPKKSVLILGKEKEGIPSDIVSIVDQCIEIPQYGVIRSLNVHVSASIFIYEYTTQFMENLAT